MSLEGGDRADKDKDAAASRGCLRRSEGQGQNMLRAPAGVFTVLALEQLSVADLRTERNLNQAGFSTAS